MDNYERLLDKETFKGRLLADLQEYCGECWRAEGDQINTYLALYNFALKRVAIDSEELHDILAVMELIGNDDSTQVVYEKASMGPVALMSEIVEYAEQDTRNIETWYELVVANAIGMAQNSGHDIALCCAFGLTEGGECLVSTYCPLQQLQHILLDPHVIEPPEDEIDPVKQRAIYDAKLTVAVDHQFIEPTETTELSERYRQYLADHQLPLS